MLRTLVIACALFASLASGAQAALLKLTPSSATVAMGDSFTLALSILGVSDLAGWSVDVGFGSTSLVNATGASDGTFFGGGDIFAPYVIDNSAGSIAFLGAALTGFGGVSGDGLLATLSFEALAVGTANFAFTLAQLIDSSGLDIFVDASTDLFGTAVEIIERVVDNVPEPAPVALLALALAIVAAQRRRFIPRLA